MGWADPMDTEIQEFSEGPGGAQSSKLVPVAAVKAGRWPGGDSPAKGLFTRAEAGSVVSPGISGVTGTSEALSSHSICGINQ